MKTVIGFENYEVSESGVVQSKDRWIAQKLDSTKYVLGQILKQYSDKRGYQKVKLYLGSRNLSKTLSVHRIVAAAFIPNPENKPQVNHINGIKTDNRVENLEWCTNLENAQHSWANQDRVGLKGSKNPSAKLTDHDVIGIRFLLKSKFTQRFIGSLYGVDRRAITSINIGKTWGHI